MWQYLVDCGVRRRYCGQCLSEFGVKYNVDNICPTLELSDSNVDTICPTLVLSDGTVDTICPTLELSDSNVDTISPTLVLSDGTVDTICPTLRGEYTYIYICMLADFTLDCHC